MAHTRSPAAGIRCIPWTWTTATPRRSRQSTRPWSRSRARRRSERYGGYRYRADRSWIDRGLSPRRACRRVRRRGPRRRQPNTGEGPRRRGALRRAGRDRRRGGYAPADVSAVLITTPDDSHEALAIEAMRAGRDVLLQKPMAPTSAACRRILAVAAETGRDLQVSWMHRHFEEVAAARALIAEGAIGQVTSVRIRNATPGPDWGDWFFRKDIVGAGVVLQLGTHGIDLIGHLFGPVNAVSARTSTQVGQRRLRDGRHGHGGESRYGCRRLRRRWRSPGASRDVIDRGGRHRPLPHGDLRHRGERSGCAPSVACSASARAGAGSWTPTILTETPRGVAITSNGSTDCSDRRRGRDRRARRPAKPPGRRGDCRIRRSAPAPATPVEPV